MARTHSWIPVVVVAALSLTGIAGVAPAHAAECTVTLTDQTTYTGTDAAETVCVAGTGTYDIRTAGGDDTVKVSGLGATVVADLGDGNDVYSGARAATSTVTAGAGDDRVTTGNGADSVDGGAGADVIVTKGGDDTVFAGDDNDRVVTGDGADTVDAGAGDNHVSTQNGDDTVFAGDGADNVNTGAGDDAVDGGPGPDKLAGAAGDDSVNGGADDDKVNGGPGDDSLAGGGGNDAVVGSAGVDALSGGDGTDVLSGGDGDDAFDGTTLDTAVPGAGDAACSNETTLALTCTYGAVIASVDHTVVATETGWRVTVRAHAIDFADGGVSRIALVENWWNTPTENAEAGTAAGVYRSAVPTLVSGTMENGVFEAVFDLDATPDSGQLGVRVFTGGFSIDAWSMCSAHCTDTGPRTWPCISWSISDAECGYGSPMGGVSGGFPKAMRAVQFTRAAPSAPSFGPVTAYPAPPSIDPGAGVYVGTGGYVLAPLQTAYLDRAWVALPNGSGAGVPTCADFGSGSHTYRVGSFALEYFTDGMYYGWFASPTVTSLSSPCAVGTETLTVMKAGSGTGTVAGNWGTITCGDACTSSSMASNHGVLMQLTAIPAAGSVFAGWRGGGCSGTDPVCWVQFNASYNISARFDPEPTPSG